jgi:hypothetical protein
MLYRNSGAVDDFRHVRRAAGAVLHHRYSDWFDMIRTLQLFSIFCLLVVVCISDAFADTYVAVTQYQNSLNSTKYSSAPEAAEAFLSLKAICSGCTKQGVFSNSTCTNPVTGASAAHIKYVTSGGTQGCGYSGNISAVLQCPYGGTLSGSTCTRADCPSGQIYDSTGQCIPEQCPSGQYRDSSGQCKCDNGSGIGLDGQCCPTSGNGTQISRCEVKTSSATSCTYGDENGCTVRCSKVITRTSTSDSLVIYPLLALGEHCKYTGAADPSAGVGYPMDNEQLKVIEEATKDPGQPQTPDSCLMSGQGYITSGGVTTCLGGAKSNETNSETKTDAGGTSTTEKQTSVETRPDGSKVIVEVTTTTNADGSKEVTTTETSKTPSGEVITSTKVSGVTPGGVETTESTVEKSTSEKTFCEENPKSLMCEEKAKGICEIDPNAPICKKLTRSVPVAGSNEFTNNSQALVEVNAELMARFNAIRAEISAMFNASSGGGGSLPCWTGPSVLGTSFNICPANYSNEMGLIGGFVMFVAYLFGAFIVLRR